LWIAWRRLSIEEWKTRDGSTDCDQISKQLVAISSVAHFLATVENYVRFFRALIFTR
jgi:hypothetical protein